MKEKIREIICESMEAKRSLLEDGTSDVVRAAGVLIKALAAGKKVLIFGNGGSAADSQHMAAELVGRFKKERKAIPAIALTTNASTLTAIANDYGYDVSFSRQVEALGRRGDVAIGISTSGNSKNVIEAIRKSSSMGLKTIGLSGGAGGILKKEADTTICVRSKDTPRIQESHILVIHILCELIEKELFGK